MGIFKHLGSRKAQKSRDGVLKFQPVGRESAKGADGDPVASRTEGSEDQLMLAPEAEEGVVPVEEGGRLAVPLHGGGKLPEGWTLIDEREWSLGILQAMDWKLFENFCAEIFRRKGNEVEKTGTGVQGGIDFVVKSVDVDVAVQCKHWKPGIDLRQVREFFGAAVQAGYDQMVFITAGEFDDRVRQAYREDKSVQLIDGEALLRNINKMGVEVSDELLQLVVRDSGDWQTPTCVECGIKMVMRQAKEIGKRYWGCANFGRTGCYQTIDLSSEK
jgi:hypothetical protein